ncbi:MAG: hypothetical protein HWN51_01745 [Desulfobacterales bacterium]|nr:hypothetical protein [Desulfobacterales bacterium]
MSDIGRDNKALRGPVIGADIAGSRGAGFRPGSSADVNCDNVAAMATLIVTGQPVPVRLGVILPWVHVGLIAKLSGRLPVDQDRGPWLAALAAAVNSARAE